VGLSQENDQISRSGDVRESLEDPPKSMISIRTFGTNLDLANLTSERSEEEQYHGKVIVIMISLNQHSLAMRP
jgi:hypothetical protein